MTVATAKADRGSTAGVLPASDQPESWWTKTAAIWTVLGVLVAAGFRDRHPSILCGFATEGEVVNCEL